MKWNRIELKLGGSILLLFLAVLLPLGFVVNQIFSGFYYTKIKQEIDQLSSRYAASIDTVSDLNILTMFERLANLTNTELYIVDEEGRIVANSGVPGIQKGAAINQEEIKALKTEKQLSKEYKDPISGQRFLVSGRPIFNGAVLQGGIFVLSSVEEIDQSVYKIRQLIVLSGIGALFLAVGFTFIVSRKLSDPLIQMEKATRRISKGKLDTRVQTYSNDEIGSLGQAINDLAIELKRYRDNRQEFFANISHELRTPITYLEGYAAILKDRLYQSEEEKNQYLVIIQQEAKRLTQLINDLFDLSKMEEGRVDLNFEWIDLTEVTENAISKVSLKARAKNIDLKTDIKENMPSIYADGLRVEQVLLNLLENAIRYTEKGSVQVRLFTKEANTVNITVEDTGMGIPVEEIPYIFERFYRVEKSRSRQYGGTGLGLSIVQKLVDLQGGTIKVTSKEGKGTCFEIAFPTSKKGE